MTKIPTCSVTFWVISIRIILADPESLAIATEECIEECTIDYFVIMTDVSLKYPILCLIFVEI